MDTPPLVEWTDSALRESNRQLNASPKEQLFARCALRMGHIGLPADTLCRHTVDTVQMCGRLGLLHTGTSLCVLTGGEWKHSEKTPSERSKGAWTFQHWIPLVLGGYYCCLHLRTIQMPSLKFLFKPIQTQLKIVRALSLKKKSIQGNMEARY